MHIASHRLVENGYGRKRVRRVWFADILGHEWCGAGGTAGARTREQHRIDRDCGYTGKRFRLYYTAIAVRRDFDDGRGLAPTPPDLAPPIASVCRYVRRGRTWRCFPGRAYAFARGRAAASLARIVAEAVARFDARPLYRASIEARRELRGPGFGECSVCWPRFPCTCED